jgi:hypothetical protein
MTLSFMKKFPGTCRLRAIHNHISHGVHVLGVPVVLRAAKERLPHQCLAMRAEGANQGQAQKNP